MTFAVIVFLVCLAIIASERIDRTKVALMGAAIVVAAGTIDQELAIGSIDWGTIGLLVGMMVMVRITEQTGIYGWLAIRAAQLSRGRPSMVVLALVVTTAVLSAFLDNVTTVLLIVPVTFVLAKALDIDPVPLIVIEVMASNIGGTATLIGDPPNILIAGHTGLSFGAFITNLAPIAVVTLAVVMPGLYLFYRRRLQIRPEAQRRVMELDAVAAITQPAEARRTVPVLLAAIAVFFVHSPLGLEPATVALTGAALMLLLSGQQIEATIASIEWLTLFFLIGLFVLVGALEHTGALSKVAEGIASATGDSHALRLMAILWSSVVGSAVVDNIPFTAAMLPVVEQLGGAADDAYWWALALGACFGGNTTIVAAAANVAASGLSERAGHPIGFIAFMRVGIPVTIASGVLATLYVLLRYV